MIVITGGLPFSKNKAEALNIDGTPLCQLPDLPAPRYYHSMSGGMICGGGLDSATLRSCIKFEKGKWEELPWKLQEDRMVHVSWTRSNGKTRLLGGRYSPFTSEIVSETGSEAGFSLKHKIWYCQALSLSTLFFQL